ESVQALYVHIPFCAKHCAYCDFNVHVVQAQSELVPQTVEAICQDIEQTAQALTSLPHPQPLSGKDELGRMKDECGLDSSFILYPITPSLPRRRLLRRRHSHLSQRGAAGTDSADDPGVL